MLNLKAEYVFFFSLPLLLGAGMFMKADMPNDKFWITCEILSNGDFLVGGSSANYWYGLLSPNLANFAGPRI